jgi:hypothetical protein
VAMPPQPRHYSSLTRGLFTPLVLRVPLLMATFGLAINAVVWSVPLTVAATGLPHALLPDQTPAPAEVLRSLPHDPSTTSVREALLRLIGAESEALRVAGAALQQPLPGDIGPQADHAGREVHSAATEYIRAAQAMVDPGSRK